MHSDAPSLVHDSQPLPSVLTDRVVNPPSVCDDRAVNPLLWYGVRVVNPQSVRNVLSVVDHSCAKSDLYLYFQVADLPSEQHVLFETNHPFVESYRDDHP